MHGDVDNRDVCAIAPRATQVTPGDPQIAIIYDAGLAAGRLGGMRLQFPGAGIAIFGHNHVPLIEHDADGVLILSSRNPTERRRQPVHTMAEVVLGNGRRAVAPIINLGAQTRSTRANL